MNPKRWSCFVTRPPDTHPDNMIHKTLAKLRKHSVGNKEATSYCRSLTKVKFSADQVRPALGSDSWLVGGLLTMLKNLKTALFQTFSTWHRILSAFTALYWPSTAFYWPSTTKYQPVPPYTDPVPSWINHYRLILIQCHQVPTSRATYWPSTIMYQPVSPSSDPVPPSTEQYRLLLNQYHHISTSTAPYWPSTTKYQSIPTYTDPVPPSTNQWCPILTSTTKY